MRYLFFSLLVTLPFMAHARSVHEWLPGIVCPPEVEFALPEEYTVAGYQPDMPAGMLGQLWGNQATIEDLWSNESGLPKEQGVFYVDASASVAQTGLTTFSCEENMEAELKEAGFQDVATRKLQWGLYPVLVIEATKNQRPIAMAWIGLNYATNTLIVNFLFAEEPTAWETDRQTWRNFLEQTTSQA